MPLIFVGKMCVFVSRPMKNNGETPKLVVDFPRERDTFRNKTVEIVEDFDEKNYNNNGKPWKSSRILRLKSMFSIFLSSFFHFFIFLQFFNFLSFSLSFLFLFLCFFSFSFIFFFFVGAQNLIFLGLNFVTISLDSSYVKNQFLGPSRVVHTGEEGTL